jgi:hypothetical protein
MLVARMARPEAIFMLDPKHEAAQPEGAAGNGAEVKGREVEAEVEAEAVWLACQFAKPKTQSPKSKARSQKPPFFPFHPTASDGVA